MENIYSAVKPTGRLTLGHFIGAINNWKTMQDNYNCIFAIADLHSLTVANKPEDLRKNTYLQFASMKTTKILLHRRSQDICQKVQKS